MLTVCTFSKDIQDYSPTVVAKAERRKWIWQMASLRNSNFAELGFQFLVSSSNPRVYRHDVQGLAQVFFVIPNFQSLP